MNDIIGFKTKEKYYVIDHILTQKNMNIGFLKNKSLKRENRYKKAVT